MPVEVRVVVSGTNPCDYRIIDEACALPNLLLFLFVYSNGVGFTRCVGVRLELDLSWDRALLKSGLGGASQRRVADGRRGHIVHGVIALKQGLAEQEVVIGIRHQQNNAKGRVAVRIPNVLFGLNLDPILRKHHIERFELLGSLTIDKADALFDVHLW